MVVCLEIFDVDPLSGPLASKSPAGAIPRITPRGAPCLSDGSRDNLSDSSSRNGGAGEPIIY
jgi:hypothetical protein